MQKVLSPLLFTIVLVLSVFAQEVDLVKMRTEQGILKIEADLSWHTLRVRGKPWQFGLNCTISETELLQLIEKLVTEKDSLLKAQTFSSFMLGRVVEFPWLEEFLMGQAAQSPEWQAERGRLTKRQVHINEWVAKVLFKHPIWQKVRQMLRKSGYDVSKISVEKVLVNDVPKIGLESVKDLTGKLPFDAQVSLILKKN